MKPLKSSINTLELHRDVADLDVQLIPVSVLWGRSPGKEDKASLPNLRLLNGLQKPFAAIWFGRDTFVRFLKRFLCVTW